MCLCEGLGPVLSSKRKQKRGKCSSPRSVLSIEKDTVVVTIPGSSDCPTSFAVEDVRFAVIDDELAQPIQKGTFKSLK